MSTSHPQQWTINRPVERPDPVMVEAFRALATTQIADCGGPVGVVGPGLHHLAGPTEVCGPAVTVWTDPGDIVFPVKAADLIEAGDVLVIDSGGRLDAAVIGDIAGQTVVDRGGAGLVVDGAVRDIDGLEGAGLPTFARGAFPAIGSKRGPGAVNVEISVGGVVVRPGDLVRADSSGLVVIAREVLSAVLDLTTAVAEREEAWRAAIAGGQSLGTAAGLDALIAEREPRRPTRGSTELSAPEGAS